MSEVAWAGFILVSVIASGFFFIKHRRFDLLTIAYVGAMFYFSPLFWGRVLQSSKLLDTTIQPAVYAIATAYLAVLTLAALIDNHEPALPMQAGRYLSGWYLVFSLVGFVVALIATKGALIDANKTEVLKQVGYGYVLFEIAASLACISAVAERRGWIIGASSFLLVVDLLIGFRVYAVLTALSVALVMLAREGRIRLFTKASSYGVAALLLILGMLLVHSARFFIFDEMAIMLDTPRVVESKEMRGDILQYASPRHPSLAVPNNAEKDSPFDIAISWLQTPLYLLQRSEPSVIQATLVAVVQTDLTCKPSNILKSLFLLVPPGLSRFIPNPYPATFYDEYQPILYPGLTYGTGGNIWAEMLCRFGYPGVAIFGVCLILVLIWLSRLLARSNALAAPPLALCGVIIAFYINRNDLQVTLVMLRQVAMVFGLAYCVSRVSALDIGFRQYRPW